MRGPQPWQTTRARVLRQPIVPAELRLWYYLRDRQLGGFKFVRQMPVGDYFGDFVCRERKLIVEIDGATHSTDEEMASDARRTDELEKLGYQVFRVSNTDVRDNIDGALGAILHELENESVPSPRTSRGEG